ncbi:phosphoribosylformylglycinamidine synthase subunit PurQ [Aphanizomenon flos-aquae NRERC-008]|jgi:phosphoribosylformylglycinamidine synthase|uniref:Phosphoribosylformylglycinamidine synthase subunit PurQ n=2 Tax=Aphanizomenon flos-aquae TaxID=1176 RepID=A0ABR8IKF5_APHFL|nr:MULTISPECIES: phosphoribosylformylglycinamidine synthase subunit PurQ [Aphanizomenon]MBD1218867.1 phosphoribosylformylglycinamidine synthase subunit PurQ [Aphanizomenon flos-aquae Clear-A1]MCE2906254.1 phosphoribosylformylglycinamidine synthase subunit PurQ [Anabaena sp. CoA2_C59]MDJ0504801.1 phosphoribosylformylglycinamidine synthase subunit PurQ [Nostocales cyanobacterium LE14-WE12]QSV67281.1 MAG: phosphoribosylformylglycinamidine synthase subunit PurQ [Aphanizomenon flos-aquae DEX188]MBD
MKFGILVFPGSNCDRDVAYVTRDLLGQATRMIWHQETDISDIDVVIIPGGFSYGDYLRCGAIARFSPVMQQVIDHALKGKFVIGICNGFQVLTEAGLLPGALARNQDLHFICDRSSLKVERNNLPWTYGYTEGEVITLPIAHGEGRFYSDESTLAEIEANGQVLFRYQENPNGSLNDIAGICNLQGNVLGMMPHPERAADKALGNSDGLRLFQGLLERVGAVV